MLTGCGGSAAIEGWPDRVDRVEAKSAPEHWAIPMAGSVPAPGALLIRPDGYVAWATYAGGQPDGALRTALATWFGPAR